MIAFSMQDNNSYFVHHCMREAYFCVCSDSGTGVVRTSEQFTSQVLTDGPSGGAICDQRRRHHMHLTTACLRTSFDRFFTCIHLFT